MSIKGLCNKHIRFDLVYLKMARELSLLSYCNRKKVGVIIVKDNIIISDGYNGTPSGYDNSCEENGSTKWYVFHAESSAIAKIAISTNSSKGATLYSTSSPCRDCCKLILQSGISRVVYADEYRETEGIELLKNSGVEVSQLDI